MKTDYKIGVVGIPGNWSSERLADTVEKITNSRYLINMENVYYDSEKGNVMHDNLNLASLDALIIKKVGETYSPNLLDRLEILRLLEDKELKIFSSPNKIIRLLNRLSCTITLKVGDIPMPPTVITENPKIAENSVQKYKKAILKPLYSTKARGMVVVDANNGAQKDISNFRKVNPIMYIQKMVDIPGKDLGITFLGGKYLATYARIKTNDSWNTTTHSGGKYEAYTPSQNLIDIAYKAQSLFNLDFTCVDIVETSDGPLVFEVSAFGGFKGLLEGNNIDAADLYTRYVIERLNND